MQGTNYFIRNGDTDKTLELLETLLKEGGRAGWESVKEQLNLEEFFLSGEFFHMSWSSSEKISGINWVAVRQAVTRGMILAGVEVAVDNVVEKACLDTLGVPPEDPQLTQPGPVSLNFMENVYGRIVGGISSVGIKLLESTIPEVLALDIASGNLFSSIVSILISRVSYHLLKYYDAGEVWLTNNLNFLITSSAGDLQRWDVDIGTYSVDLNSQNLITFGSEYDRIRAGYNLSPVYALPEIKAFLLKCNIGPLKDMVNKVEFVNELERSGSLGPYFISLEYWVSPRLPGQSKPKKKSRTFWGGQRQTNNKIGTAPMTKYDVDTSDILNSNIY